MKEQSDRSDLREVLTDGQIRILETQKRQKVLELIANLAQLEAQRWLKANKPTVMAAVRSELERQFSKPETVSRLVEEAVEKVGLDVFIRWDD